MKNKKLKSKPRLKGTVRWFDKNGGTGMIRDENGRSHWVYACNILGAKTAFEHTACVHLENGTDVTFELYEDCGAVNVSGGIVDEAHWTKINDGTLSFVKDPNGGFLSGLFADKKEA